MNETGAVKNVINAFKAIDFVTRIEAIMNHSGFDNRMTRIDKKVIIARLSDLGYEFKVFTPGRDFYFDVNREDWRFRFSFNLNGGIILPYIFVYDKNGNKVPYQYPNLIFTYKYLIDDLDKLLNPATIFCSYEEFEEIISELLELFEDFQEAFLNHS